MLSSPSPKPGVLSTSIQSAGGWEKVQQNHGWALPHSKQAITLISSCSVGAGRQMPCSNYSFSTFHPTFPCCWGFCEVCRCLSLPVKLHFEYKVALLSHGNSKEYRLNSQDAAPDFTWVIQRRYSVWVIQRSPLLTHRDWSLSGPLIASLLSYCSMNTTRNRICADGSWHLDSVIKRK